MIRGKPLVQLTPTKPKMSQDQRNQQRQAASPYMPRSQQKQEQVEDKPPQQTVQQQGGQQTTPQTVQQQGGQQANQQPAQPITQILETTPQITGRSKTRKERLAELSLSKRRKSVRPSFQNVPSRAAGDMMKYINSAQNPVDAIARVGNVIHSSNNIPKHLPKFSGAKHENIDEWLQTMAELCEVYQWQPSEHLRAILQNLEDGAFRTWITMPTHLRQNLDEVLKALLLAHGDVEERPDYRIEVFESTTQGADTVQNYYTKLLQRARAADLNISNNPSHRDIFIRTFRRGLRQNLQKKLNNKYFDDMDKFLLEAKKKEKKIVTDNSSTINAITKSNTQLMSKINELTKVVAAMQGKQHRNRCDYCGKPGHTSQQCYKRKRQQQQKNNNNRRRCTYCGKGFHTEEKCWHKHPNLAPSSWRRKGKQSKN